MMTHDDSHSELKKYPPTALFLETSAQILRLQGPGEIQKGIRELIDATRKNSGQIGTSAYVKREFHFVINGFFDEVQARIKLLIDRETDRPIEQLWREVRDVHMPKYFVGRRSLLDDLGDYIVDLYKGRRVRPMFLDSVVATYRDHVTRGFNAFKVDLVFDNSTCEVWDSADGTCSACGKEPSVECELRNTTVTNRANFLASLKTMAGAARLAESKWLKTNLEILQHLEGKALNEFLRRNPGAMGDAIIFWEVQDGWTILSRDEAFQILKDKHRAEIDCFMVRIPRRKSGKTCTLRPEGAAGDVEGVLDNFNSKGARVHAPSIATRTRQLIDIQSEELSPRTGRVTKFHKPASAEEAKINQLRPTFGLKFTTSKGKR